MLRTTNKSKRQPRRKQRTQGSRTSLNMRPTTLNWNVVAQAEPGMRNVTKRDNRVYTVHQTSGLGVVVTSGNSLPTFYTRAFSTSDILQFASFAALFDQYKIEAVEVWFTPYGAATASGYANNVHIYTVVDYDDANAPTSVGAMQVYQNCVETRCTEGHYIKFRPHIATAAYGGAFTQFKNEPASWMDSASTSTQHYGVKLGIDATASVNDLRIDGVCRLTVSFRNVF